MELELRRVNYRDWRQLAALMPAVFPQLTKDLIASYLCYMWQNMGVATIGDRIIGFYQFDPARTAQTAWLNYIGVGKNRSRKSVGTHLLRYFEEHARSLGFIKVELYVHEDNIAAHKFYEKNGYRFVEIRRGPVDTNRLYTKEIASAAAQATYPHPAKPATITSFFKRIKCKFFYAVYVILPNTLSFSKRTKK